MKHSIYRRYKIFQNTGKKNETISSEIFQKVSIPGECLFFLSFSLEIASACQKYITASIKWIHVFYELNATQEREGYPPRDLEGFSIEKETEVDFRSKRYTGKIQSPFC